MRKVLLLIFIVIVICLGAAYIFIPARITVTTIVSAHCIPKNISDCVRDQSVWKKWWPGSYTDTSICQFIYAKYCCKLVQPFTNGAEIQLNKGPQNFKARILAVPFGIDSSLLQSQTVLAAGNNPFKRIVLWLDSKELKRNMEFLLDSLVRFAEKTENIYGFNIERTTFTDTILAATKFFTKTYPTTDAVYSAIDQLKKKIKEEGALEKDFPMLNVRQIDSNQFETMIAICINKLIKNDGNIFFTRMVPMKDRFLKTEATGGPVSIKNAHEAINNFMQDRFLSAPGIPFEILITDRRRSTDTSKWKTTIFHPSM